MAAPASTPASISDVPTAPSRVPAATTTSVIADIPASTSSAASDLSYGQLERAVAEWAIELEEQEKTFLAKAAKVNAFDRALAANEGRIVALNEAVERIKADQQVREYSDTHLQCIMHRVSSARIESWTSSRASSAS